MASHPCECGCVGFDALDGGRPCRKEDICTDEAGPAGVHLETACCAQGQEERWQQLRPCVGCGCPRPRTTGRLWVVEDKPMAVDADLAMKLTKFGCYLCLG